MVNDAHEQLLQSIHQHHINIQSREIYLHGNYLHDSDEPSIEYRMATTFIKNMQLLDSINNTSIIVHMHTGGGNWLDGMAIYNTIRFAKSPVTFIVYGRATSMSGVILQAADLRILTKDSEIMLHHGSIGVDGTSLSVKSAVEVNNASCKRMLELFAIRAVRANYFKEKNYTIQQTAKYINKKLEQKGDWYLSTKEAIDYGFADGTLGEGKFNDLNKLRYNKKTRI
tara:strand:+ start:970 stop:1647 length:678 start_codon:yes stop_codon:yes gene_type:complete